MKKLSFPFKLSLAGKFALVFTLLSIVVTGATGLMVFHQNSRDLIEKELGLLGQESLGVNLRFQQQVNAYIRDARFLSAVPPIAGIIRSWQTGVDSYDDTTLPILKERLQLIFTHFLGQNPEYFQIRFIGVDDGGRELVRVEKQLREIVVIPDHELQTKGDREYFQATHKLDRSKVLLSKINYNRDHGRITHPVIRTLRVALPVFDGNRVFGIIIINVNIGPELDRLNFRLIDSEAVYLFDSDGDFLVHPDPEKCFSFETDTPYITADDIATRSLDLDSDSGTGPAKSPRVWVDGNNVKAFNRIILADQGTAVGETQLFMLVVTPKHMVLQAVTRNQRQSFFLTSALILLSAGLIIILSRYLTRPLTQMTEEVMGFRTGSDTSGSLILQGDEIHILGRAFDTMTRRIDQSIADLEARENRLQSIMTTAAEGLVIIDKNGIINDVNPATEDLFGYTREEMLGENVSMLMPPPHDSRHDGYLEKYLEAGTANIIGKGRGETGRRKDGSLVQVALSVSQFEVRDQLYFTGFVRDISEEKMAQEALAKAKEELEDRVANRTDQLSLLNAALRLKVGELNVLAERLKLFKQVFTQSNESIVITDDKERIIDVNVAYIKSSGFSRDSLIGSKPRIGQSDSHGKDFSKIMWNTIRAKGNWKGEIWDRRKTGEVFPKLLSISAVTDFVGRTTHYVGIFSDISKLKATEEKLKNMAYYDPLTGLPNRELFRVLLQREIDQVIRNKTMLAVMYLDLDRFKYVNDTYGHSIGDLLLIKVADRLKGCVRKEDTVARLGGDEFIIILRQLDKPGSAARLAQKIIKRLTHRIRIQEKELFVGASIGISLCPQDGCDMETLMKNADMAMYRVKENGRSHYHFFEPEMDQMFARRVALDEALRHALDRDEFVLYYQPKVSVNTGLICGAEALIRWQREGMGIISPDAFIPIAEETGLIEPIGEWVLRTASHQCRIWQEHYPHPFKMSVNLSMRQFLHHDLIGIILGILDETKLNPTLLDLEITETIAASDMNRTIQIQNSIRSLGISISIDDFGTGYSSLSYLKKFPIQNLKVDRSFVSDVANNQDDASIVQAIIALGHTLGLKVVAEGVETKEQLDFLKDLDCNEYQGYYFHAPMPAEDFTRLLAEHGGMKNNRLLKSE